jgi:hypothetical protein
MYKNSARLLIVLGLTSMVCLPSYARGFGGGGFHGGGFHGGGFGGGGFHGFEGSGIHAGTGFHGGSSFHPNTAGFGGHESHPNFGGGFNDAGAKPVMSNHPNYAGGGQYAHAGQMPNHSQFPTDGGFGSMSGNRTPQNFDKNSFNGNGNTFNKTNEFNKNVNVNNINASGYHGGAYNGYHGGAYGGYHPYGGGAYGYHPYGGAYGGYHPYGGYGYGYNPTAMMWTCAGISSLTSLTSFLGMSAIMGASNNANKQPASYSNVTYNGGNVYIDGQPSGSDQAFYQQAQQLAATAYNTPYTAAPAAVTNTSYPGMPVAEGVAPGVATGYSAQGANPALSAVPGQPMAAAASGDWQPLGTFNLAEAGQTQSNMVLQMEINKDGVLHGTYFNQLTMESAQVYGALDKATQRVSWTLGTNPSTVFDAGLGDLMKEDSSVLVHYSPTNTQRMALIRLKEPPAGIPGGAPGAGQPLPQAQPG